MRGLPEQFIYVLKVFPHKSSNPGINPCPGNAWPAGPRPIRDFLASGQIAASAVGVGLGVIYLARALSLALRIRSP
jgi:hypothetical protein